MRSSNPFGSMNVNILPWRIAWSLLGGILFLTRLGQWSWLGHSPYSLLLPFLRQGANTDFRRLLLKYNDRSSSWCVSF